MARAALRAGKHVICEKPFVLNTAEARAIYELAQSSGLTAMIAHEFRFSSGRAWARELIRDGYIGDLRMCLMRLVLGGLGPGGTPPFSPDRDLAARGGGFLFGLGSHYIDCLRDWFGEVESVSGDLYNFAPDRLSGSEIVKADADDTFSITLNFINGGFAHVIATRAAPFGSGAAVEIYGDQGTLFVPQSFVNPPAHGTVLGAKVGEAALQNLPVPERLQPFADDRDDRLMPFRLQVREFLRGVAEGTSPAPNFYDGLRCQQVLDAVRESSASGERVVIPQE
jgi:predicted dehydrogenase